MDEKAPQRVKGGLDAIVDSIEVFLTRDPTTAVVVVDDVANFGAAAVDDPVVPVEGQLVAQQRPEPGPRRELRRLAAKVLQRRVAAFLRSGYLTYLWAKPIPTNCKGCHLA